ncbi:MAG: protocatechuate 3,4-dioxygenase subunit alpha [Candidatus Sulfotelmatobacter sp.]|jgi:protocatechuate 3,4-dioxygenase, alpha subunit
MDLTPTPSQTVGPYLHLGLTDARSRSRVAGDGAKGERVWLTFRVLDGDGVPVPDAMIELWQADSEGNYAHQDSGADDAAFRGFGRSATAEDGSCTFETIKPGRVSRPSETVQAPHINVSILGRGILKRLSTRVYFAGEPANAADPVLALVPENRRTTLLAQPDPARTSNWILDVHLRGEGETVFFDV